MSRQKSSSTNINIRVLPTERRALEQLADRLNCNLSAAVKLSLYQSFRAADISLIDFQQTASKLKDTNVKQESKHE